MRTTGTGMAHHTGFRHTPEDEAARRRWQHPEFTLEGIGLTTGDTFIDVGCGDGFFALPAARRDSLKPPVSGQRSSRREVLPASTTSQTANRRCGWPYERGHDDRMVRGPGLPDSDNLP